MRPPEGGRRGATASPAGGRSGCRGDSTSAADVRSQSAVSPHGGRRGVLRRWPGSRRSRAGADTKENPVTSHLTRTATAILAAALMLSVFAGAALAAVSGPPNEDISFAERGLTAHASWEGCDEPDARRHALRDAPSSTSSAGASDSIDDVRARELGARRTCASTTRRSPWTRAGSRSNRPLIAAGLQRRPAADGGRHARECGRRGAGARADRDGLHRRPGDRRGVLRDRRRPDRSRSRRCSPDPAMSLPQTLDQQESIDLRRRAGARSRRQAAASAARRPPRSRSTGRRCQSAFGHLSDGRTRFTQRCS